MKSGQGAITPADQGKELRKGEIERSFPARTTPSDQEPRRRESRKRRRWGRVTLWFIKLETERSIDTNRKSCSKETDFASTAKRKTIRRFKREPASAYN
jgi:hypothetical protein